jgi:hypothetical protein
MMERYPGVDTILYVVHWQASLLFPEKCSDRIITAPGIFRDPSGATSGEAARA